MCTIFNSCSMSPHLIWVGYTNLNKSETGTYGIIDQWVCTDEMLPVNSCQFILSIEFKKLTPSENLSSQKKEKGDVEFDVLKNMWIKNLIKPQTQTQRLHEAEKNC